MTAAELAPARSLSLVDALPARRPGRARLARLGPAFVAAVAYVDPGNVATNMTAGVRHGYMLVWVVVAASVMAMLVQYLSAKLGLVTASTLPALCRERCSRSVSLVMWLQAELVALATELAEVLGGAIALELLFGVPLLVGAVATALCSMLVLALQRRGHQRPFEAVVAVLLGVCALGFVFAAVRSGPSVGAIVAGVLPRFEGQESLLLAAGILGATVMPHAIYLHSALVRDRFDLHGAATDVAETQRRAGLLRATRTDILLALSLAAVVNLSLMVVAAAQLRDAAGADTIEGAAHQIGLVLGSVVAVLFAVGLLASGLASSSVGAYAGSVVIEGFTDRHISPALRRSLTLVPALAIVVMGVDPTRALVLSQVVLSLGIPFAVWPLVRLTADRSLMGPFANRPTTTWGACTIAFLMTTLVAGLTWQALT